MLWSAIIVQLRQIQGPADAPVGRRRTSGPETEQSLERGHRHPPTVVAKNEFVQVNLKLRATDAVIGANQPLLEVADRAVHQWHRRLGPLAQVDSQGLGTRNVLVTCCVQTREGLEPIRVNRGAWRDIALNETSERCRLEIGDHRHAEATRDVPALLDGGQHERRTTPLELSAPPEPRLGSADPGIVDLNLSVEWFAPRIDHRPPELVEHQPGCFVSTQSQLTLEKQRGNSSFVRGHQIRGPEPHCERDLRVVQNRPGRQRHLESAGGALPASAFHEGIGVLVPARRHRDPQGQTQSGNGL